MVKQIPVKAQNWESWRASNPPPNPETRQERSRVRALSLLNAFDACSAWLSPASGCIPPNLSTSHAAACPLMHLSTRRKCFDLANLVGWNHLSSAVHNQFLLLPRHVCTMSSSKRQRPAVTDDHNDPSISPPPVKRKVQSTVTSRRTRSPRAALPASKACLTDTVIQMARSPTSSSRPPRRKTSPESPGQNAHLTMTRLPLCSSDATAEMTPPETHRTRTMSGRKLLPSTSTPR